ncbi:chromate transporter [Cohnella fermenti]|uniref:Chromate transporter n=1 Tax=Cohnella fermenti TaxID=2565925 RepID=A0A4S4BIL9_9BACL|nr:chromate transporter [Cohnella fermenti]THF73449.1 chromate transporter [Cohnella fermenti]
MPTTMREQTSKLAELFRIFLRIGPMTFGGGFAMIPLISEEVVAKREWLEEKELDDMLSVASAAPGGVGVNAAAFIGYRRAGVAGAIAAVIGVTLPTFAIGLLFYLFYSLLENNVKVQAALQGIHGAVIGLMVTTAYRMSKAAIFDKMTIGLACLSLLGLTVFGLNPLWVISGGTLIGVAYLFVEEKLGHRIATESRRKAKRAKPEAVGPEYYI